MPKTENFKAVLRDSNYEIIDTENVKNIVWTAAPADMVAGIVSFSAQRGSFTACAFDINVSSHQTYIKASYKNISQTINITLKNTGV